jgi:hypothetical protein
MQIILNSRYVKYLINRNILTCIYVYIKNIINSMRKFEINEKENN